MRIVVVGAGVVGLACGYELLQDGHDVLVLDSARAGQAASHGNAAKIAVAEAGPVPAPGMVIQGLKWMLRPDSPLYVKPSLSPRFLQFMLAMARNCTEEQFRAGLALNLRLASKANEMFDEWQDAGLHFEMHQRGVLLAYENKAHFESRLRHQDVFSRYGEAIYQLVHEGSLVQTPYKGITVAQPSPQDLLDVAEVRASLETLAALRLGQDPDGEGMAKLRQALKTHLDAIEAGDLVRVDLTHLDLHRTLWEGSENQMLMRIWPLVESQIRMAMSLDQATRSDLARDAELHIRLVDVIASGDKAAITAEVREHIANSADEVVKLIERGKST